MKTHLAYKPDSDSIFAVMISPPYLLIPFHLLFQPLFHSVDQSFLAHCFHILHGLKKDNI